MRDLRELEVSQTAQLDYGGLFYVNDDPGQYT